jgi:hypothetical protein
MAHHAVRRNPGEMGRRVAFDAGNRAMRAGQGESNGRVVESGPGPEGDAVTLGALLGEASGRVIRIPGPGILRLVTADAGRRPGNELLASLGGRAMAGGTVEGAVRPFQREAGELVAPGHRRAIEEAPRGVTAGAVRSQLTPMDIGVTAAAGGARALEVEGGMTGPAGGRAVGPGKGIA